MTGWSLPASPEVAEQHEREQARHLRAEAELAVAEMVALRARLDAVAVRYRACITQAAKIERHRVNAHCGSEHCLIRHEHRHPRREEGEARR